MRSQQQIIAVVMIWICSYAVQTIAKAGSKKWNCFVCLWLYELIHFISKCHYSDINQSSDFLFQRERQPKQSETKQSNTNELVTWFWWTICVLFLKINSVFRFAFAKHAIFIDSLWPDRIMNEKFKSLQINVMSPLMHFFHFLTTNTFCLAFGIDIITEWRI